MIIRSEQYAVLSGTAEDVFKEELVRHCHDFAPELCKVAGIDNIRATVNQGIASARQYGFTMCGPLRFYVELMLSFGSDFDADPQLPWAAGGLNDREFNDEFLRADSLYKRMNEFCDRVMGADNEHALEALQRAVSARAEDYKRFAGSFENRVSQILEQGFPQKHRYIGASAVRELADRSQAFSAEFRLHNEPYVAYLAVLMFSFGWGVIEDRLYPWIGNTLRDERTSTMEQRMERLERKVKLYAERALQNLTRKPS